MASMNTELIAAWRPSRAARLHAAGFIAGSKECRALRHRSLARAVPAWRYYLRVADELSERLIFALLLPWVALQYRVYGIVQAEQCGATNELPRHYYAVATAVRLRDRQDLLGVLTRAWVQLEDEYRLDPSASVRAALAQSVTRLHIRARRMSDASLWAYRWEESLCAMIQRHCQVFGSELPIPEYYRETADHRPPPLESVFVQDVSSLVSLHEVFGLLDHGESRDRIRTLTFRLAERLPSNDAVVAALLAHMKSAEQG